MKVLWKNCHLLTMKEGKYNAIENGAIITEGDTIAWIGEFDQLSHASFSVENDLNGAWVTPGFIDTHTHLVFGGDRSAEFEKRLNGVSYSQIAAEGGGIVSTVNATRHENEDQLFKSAKKRVEMIMADGATVIEIKSGYGLDLATELKMLKVIERLQETVPITIKSTYLAAHALPKEYEGRSDEYIDYIIDECLPVVLKTCKIDAIDAFCEHLAFSPAQVERIFVAAKKHNVPVKIHAEQLSSLHGSTLAANYSALSADHLEYAVASDAKAMAKAGTVAVLLPGAFYSLRETQLPPIDEFRKEGVKIALATDLNPGTSPVLSLRLVLNMGCTLFQLTPEESLSGVTYNAAFALGIEKTHGSLEVGKKADFVAWDIDHPAQLSYWIGGTLANKVVCNGNRVN